MKIVFFGTSAIGIPILDKLRLDHEILAVVTSPDAPVGRKRVVTPSEMSLFADKCKIATLKPQKAKNNPELISELTKLGADIFIVVSYGKILPEELINIPKLKTLNVHFSLLPKYRGASPIQFALLNGEETSGTTIFILDKGMDTGPVLVSQEEQILPSDNFESLSKRLAKISANLLIDLLPKYEAGILKAQTQDHDQATSTGLIKKEDGLINWHRSAQEIFNLSRAYSTWPGIWTTLDGKKFKILSCAVSEETIDAPEGTLLELGVSCGNNTLLQLKTVQLEGKNPTDFQDFLRGNKDAIGKILGEMVA